MRSFLILFLFICTTLSSLASLPYENIKEEAKLSVFENTWTTKVNRKDSDYFIKFISSGTGNYSEYYKSSGEFGFSTGCQYEFIRNGNLIGYSNPDLKFYDFTLTDEGIYKRELSEDEVQELFPDYKIIKISEFSSGTNSLKVKKEGHKFKVLLLNDTDKTFYHYSFTSGNSEFKTYPLAGLIDITKKGMILFSHFGENTENNAWYILLVR